ncbi:Subtilase family protein [compost metagenome]
MLPISKVSDVIAQGAGVLEIMRCDDVMFFRPLGQCFVPGINLHDDTVQAVPIIPPVGEDELLSPVVALLDGLPMENHSALRGRIEIDDPDEFSALYEKATEQVHGTSMASLIIHGDLSDSKEPPLERRLHVRPVMAPEGTAFGGRVREEHIPISYLPVDLIHRAVVRMKKGTADNPPTAPDVVIINLSVGDRYRLFDKHMSPLARMLDWLSVTFGVLFVVSAGNQDPTLSLEGIRENEFRSITPAQLEEAALKSIMRQRPLRRMLSPAEAINALTVSATHEDSFAGQLPPRRIDALMTQGMFSPANPITLGRRNMIKPEIMMPGGRQSYINNTHLAQEDITLTPAKTSSMGPGIRTALPSSKPGELNGYGYSAGTSNAAALATRRLAFLFESLQELKELGDADALSHAPDAVILKALMVHGAEHGGASRSVIERHFKNRENSKNFKSHLNQMFGYGRVNETRIHSCFNNQATLIRTGVLGNDMAEDYVLPLPACLSASTENRRLIVTLAWLSPVRFDHQDYRGAQLWATPPEDKLNVNTPDYYHHYLRNGTVFHEVRKGEDASTFTDGDRMIIRVNCKLRAGLKSVKIPYAIVVTLDTLSDTLPIYHQVRHELEIDAARQRVQQQGN